MREQKREGRVRCAFAREGRRGSSALFAAEDEGRGGGGSEWIEVRLLLSSSSLTPLG